MKPDLKLYDKIIVILPRGKTDPLHAPRKHTAPKTRLEIPFRGAQVYVIGRVESRYRKFPPSIEVVGGERVRSAGLPARPWARVNRRPALTNRQFGISGHGG